VFSALWNSALLLGQIPNVNSKSWMDISGFQHCQHENSCTFFLNNAKMRQYFLLTFLTDRLCNLILILRIGYDLEFDSSF
jgi:hypothetical protein